MSTLPHLVEVMVRHVAFGDLRNARIIANQAASKVGGERGERMAQYLRNATQAVTSLKHWSPAVEPRSPWARDSVVAGISRWLIEARHADRLLAAGERMMPLLLAGETRCGKTSILCKVARELDVPVFRMSLASVVRSGLGESAALMIAALQEAALSPPAIWLIDELDAVAGPRLSGDAAAQERVHAVGALLAALDGLPPNMMVAATSNRVEGIDGAVRARFQTVSFPAWSDLVARERRSFADSHGMPQSVAIGEAVSYADIVQWARAVRVTAILEQGQKRQDADNLAQCER